jgi:hypothetical protein
MCPCNEGRIGAFIVVFCLAFASMCINGGLPAMLALVAAGNALAIGWAIFGGCGVVLLVHGIFEALSHDDDFEAGSFLYSVSVIGLSVWGLLHHWYLDAASAGFSRALWLGWIASNAFNIFLQLRGRRHAAAPPAVRQRPASLPLAQRTLRRFRLSRASGNAEWTEATEWYGNDHQSSPPPQFFPAPPHIASVTGPDGEAPQIVYVQDRNGDFIPVQLPAAVPVNRRLR